MSEDKQKRKINKLALAGCLSIFVILIVVISIILGSGNDESTSIELDAGITYDGTQFIITNNDNFDWTDVVFDLNATGAFSSGYILHADLIRSGNTYTVGAMQFAKSDGTLFNPFTTKPISINITCKADGKDGYWSGGW